MGTTIDGAEHPELISDTTAYRLYLLAVSEPLLASDEQIKRQNARLGAIGLTRTDRLVLVSILAAFYANYHVLVDEYNKAATEAWSRGERTDPGPLKLQRDALVQSTHDQLRVTLSEEGWTRLDAFVQGEKKHMKISTTEVKP